MSDDLKKLTDWNKLEALLKTQEEAETLSLNAADFENHCLNLVKGQNDIVKRFA
jgi:hypothetical protein